MAEAFMLPFDPLGVAEALLNCLDQAAAARGRASLAIPGGRSPAPVLTALARLCDPALRARLILLWVDERALPRGDPERNDRPTIAAWEAGGPLPGQVLPMPAEEADLDQAAARYATALSEATRGRGLDAVLLGMGEDGHIASLFPRHAGLSELASVFAVTDSPKPPLRRLSVSLGVLRSAGQIAVLVLGAAKGPVARAAMLGADPAIPASLLPGARTLWYFDDAAAQAASAAQADHLNRVRT